MTGLFGLTEADVAFIKRMRTDLDALIPDARSAADTWRESQNNFVGFAEVDIPKMADGGVVSGGNVRIYYRDKSTNQLTAYALDSTPQVRLGYNLSNTTDIKATDFSEPIEEWVPLHIIRDRSGTWWITTVGGIDCAPFIATADDDIAGGGEGEVSFCAGEDTQTIEGTNISDEKISAGCKVRAFPTLCDGVCKYQFDPIREVNFECLHNQEVVRSVQMTGTHLITTYSLIQVKQEGCETTVCFGEEFDVVEEVPCCYPCEDACYTLLQPYENAETQWFVCWTIEGTDTHVDVDGYVQIGAIEKDGVTHNLYAHCGEASPPPGVAGCQLVDINSLSHLGVCEQVAAARGEPGWTVVWCNEDFECFSGVCRGSSDLISIGWTHVADTDEGCVWTACEICEPANNLISNTTEANNSNGYGWQILSGSPCEHYPDDIPEDFTFPECCEPCDPPQEVCWSLRARKTSLQLYWFLSPDPPFVAGICDEPRRVGQLQEGDVVINQVWEACCTGDPGAEGTGPAPSGSYPVVGFPAAAIIRDAGITLCDGTSNTCADLSNTLFDLGIGWQFVSEDDDYCYYEICHREDTPPPTGGVAGDLVKQALCHAYPTVDWTDAAFNTECCDTCDQPEQCWTAVLSKEAVNRVTFWKLGSFAYSEDKCTSTTYTHPSGNITVGCCWDYVPNVPTVPTHDGWAAWPPPSPDYDDILEPHCGDDLDCPELYSMINSGGGGWTLVAETETDCYFATCAGASAPDVGGTGATVQAGNPCDLYPELDIDEDALPGCCECDPPPPDCDCGDCTGADISFTLTGKTTLANGSDSVEDLDISTTSWTSPDAHVDFDYIDGGVPGSNDAITEATFTCQGDGTIRVDFSFTSDAGSFSPPAQFVGFGSSQLTWSDPRTGDTRYTTEITMDITITCNEGSNGCGELTEGCRFSYVSDRQIIDGDCVVTFYPHPTLEDYALNDSDCLTIGGENCCNYTKEEVEAAIREHLGMNPGENTVVVGGAAGCAPGLEGGDIYLPCDCD